MTRLPRALRHGSHFAALARTLTLALLAGCRSTPAPPPAPPTAAPPSRFEPAPRYAFTFDVSNANCRGFPDAHDGAVVLTTAPDHRTTLELTVNHEDPFAGTDIKFSPPIDRTPRPTVCRWAGTGSPAPGRWLASLEPTDELDPACGDRLPLTLDCRPDVLSVPDAGPTPVLRCTVGSSGPPIPWVLTGGDEIVLSEQSLHLQLRSATFGGSSQGFSRAPPPPTPPPPPATPGTSGPP